MQEYLIENSRSVGCHDRKPHPGHRGRPGGGPPGAAQAAAGRNHQGTNRVPEGTENLIAHPRRNGAPGRTNRGQLLEFFE